MDPVLASQIVIAASTLTASLGGYVLAGINETRRDRRAAVRDAANRESERAALREDKRHDFQLDTLLALQDALQNMSRLAGAGIHFDHMQARKGEFTQLPPGLSDEMHVNGVNVNRLVSRVLDQTIREQVADFTLFVAGLALLPKALEGLSPGQLEDAMLHKMSEFQARYDAVAVPIGESVRQMLQRMSTSAI